MRREENKKNGFPLSEMPTAEKNQSWDALSTDLTRTIIVKCKAIKRNLRSFGYYPLCCPSVFSSQLFSKYKKVTE